MRVLLIGAAGQVGTELCRSLADGHELVTTTRTGGASQGRTHLALDVADAAAIARVVRELRPDAIVNASAYTAVDRAESEPGPAFAVNADAPAAMAAAAHATGALLVHYSTDYVFDGQGSRPYREDDPTAPLGVYGASKLAGEDAIRASGARHLILRTAWVYALHGHNFLRTMLRLAGEREELRVVDDQAGCPTPAWLIADVTARLLSMPGPPQGTYHLVAGGRTTWHGFAQAIFDAAIARGLLPRAPRVVPIATSAFPTPARRPAWSVLDTTALGRATGVQLPHWREALQATFDR